MDQMTQLSSICELFYQIVQKKQEVKRIEEEQAAKAQNSKILVCYDDDDDYSAVTPSEPIDSLSMGDEHLDTIPVTELDEFIKSYVENLVPNPSESDGENGCDLPACFTTFSNILFDDDYEFDSVDDQSLHNEDFPKKIFSNPLFEEEIISKKKDTHHFNAESDLVESMLNHDSSIISSSSKIDSLLDEFAGELTLLKSIPSVIDKADCHPKNEIRFSERLLYDNSSPRSPKEFKSENSNTEIESFSPSPIPNEDSDSFMEEIDLLLTPDDQMPPSIEDDNDSEGDILFLERLLHDDPIPLPNTLDFLNVVRVFLPFFTYPVKDKQEKDKISSKPDKNGKRGEAEKSQKQLQSREKEKLKKKVVEDVGGDEDFNSEEWVSATHYVIANGGTVTGCLRDIGNFLKNGKHEQVVGIVKSCFSNVIGDLTMTLKDLSGTIPGTIHYKVIGEGGYGKDLTVGAAMILLNVSVFTPKPSNHYLNITKKNVVKVFHKDIVLASGSG
nr:GPCR kinase [Tanacetum cinerariifolium]